MSWGGGGHCTIFSLQTSEKIAQIAYRAEGRGDLGYAQKKGYFSGDVIPYSPLLLQYDHMSKVLTQIISFFSFILNLSMSCPNVESNVLL